MTVVDIVLTRLNTVGLLGLGAYCLLHAVGT